MVNHIYQIRVTEPFKSISSIDINLTNLNVLIGGAGSEKACLLDLIAFLCSTLNEAVTVSYLREQGSKIGFILDGKLSDVKFELADFFRVSADDMAATCYRVPKCKRYNFATDGRDVAELQVNLEETLLVLMEKYSKHYRFILAMLKLWIPAFGGFEVNTTEEKRSIQWVRYGKIEDLYSADPSILRIFALLILLNLPNELLPDVILLDEPEIGFPPRTLAEIGATIRTLSRNKQVILTTNSPLLLSGFTIDNIIAVDNPGSRPEYRPLKSEDYDVWLKDGFTPGELWLKGVFAK